MKYDKDYFENGLETGKSCYQNYKWMPEATMSMAMRLIDYFDITSEQTILDFGCAKGYLVYAFHLLHRWAFGVDISEYALSCVPKKVESYCRSIIPNMGFDICIAKDVFEHIPVDDLPSILTQLKQTRKIFAVIPLGDGECYRSKINNLDPTHVSCYSETEWEDLFMREGWDTVRFNFSFPGMKEHHPINSHGFFTLVQK